MSGVAIVDGANVAYTELSEQGDPKVSNLVATRRILQQKGYDPIVIVDASLRYEIDDPQQFEALLDDQVFRQAPAGTDADYFILEMAERYEGLIISNDEYEQYQDRYPWIEQVRIPLMIINGSVILYEEKLEQDRLD